MLALALLAGAPPVTRDALPPILPLDRDGVPTCPLDDTGLHWLLVALSATNEAASALLAAFRAAGRGYGMLGGRECVSGRSVTPIAGTTFATDLPFATTAS